MVAPVAHGHSDSPVKLCSAQRGTRRDDKSMIMPDTMYTRTTVGACVGVFNIRTEPSLERCVIARPDDYFQRGLRIVGQYAKW